MTERGWREGLVFTLSPVPSLQSLLLLPLLLSSENTGPHVNSQQPLIYTQNILGYFWFALSSLISARNALKSFQDSPHCMKSVHKKMSPDFFSLLHNLQHKCSLDQVKSITNFIRAFSNNNKKETRKSN